MAGLLDFLFQGQVPPSVTTRVTGTESLPAWLQELTRAVDVKAAAIANEPYKLYPGPRVAGFTQDQNQAFQNIRANQGNYQSAYNQSQNLYNQATGPLNQQEFNSYQSPYINGVVNRISELGNRNLTENILPNVNATFTGAGQFGSSRHADFTNRAIRNTQNEILGNQSAALQQSYNDAFNQYNQAQGRRLQGADSLQNLGQNIQRSGNIDVGALEASGQTQQQQNQQNLSQAYQDFLEQREYPKSQLGFVSDILRGTPYSRTTTSTSTGPGNNYGPSPLSQILGGLSLASGLGGLFGGNAEGGLIESYAEGGVVKSKKKTAKSMKNSYADGGYVIDEDLSGNDLDDELEEISSSPSYDDAMNEYAAGLPSEGVAPEEGQGDASGGGYADVINPLTGQADDGSGGYDVDDAKIQQINNIVNTRQQAALKNLQAARASALEQLRPAKPKFSDAALALAAGFLAPTRSGAFGESLGNVAQQVQPLSAERRRADQAYNTQLAKISLSDAEDAYKATSGDLKFFKTNDGRTLVNLPGVGFTYLGKKGAGSGTAKTIDQALLSRSYDESGNFNPAVYKQLREDAGLGKTGGGKPISAIIGVDGGKARQRALIDPNTGEVIRTIGDAIPVGAGGVNDAAAAYGTAYAKKSAEDDVKNISDAEDLYNSAQQAVATVDTFNESAPSGGLAASEYYIGSLFGFTPEQSKAGAAIKTLEAKFQDFHKTGSGSFSDIDAANVKQAIPQLGQTAEGRKIVSQLWLATTDNARKGAYLKQQLNSKQISQEEYEAERKKLAREYHNTVQSFGVGKKKNDQSSNTEQKTSDNDIGAKSLDRKKKFDITKATSSKTYPSGKTYYVVDDILVDEDGNPVNK